MTPAAQTVESPEPSEHARALADQARKDRRPITAITLGDPAGVGPEIVVGTVCDPSVYECARPFVIGNRKALERAAKMAGKELVINEISEPEEAKFEFGIVDLLDTGVHSDADIEFGKIQREAQLQAYSYLEKAIELGNQGRLHAVSTAPTHKEGMMEAGVRYPGQTEIFQNLTHSKYALTMFHVHKLRVFFLSRHVSLRDAVDFVTKEHVLDFLRNIHEEFERIGFDNPSIAVAGLNPHNGDNGMFGREEIEELEPAVVAARAEGIRARGPFPGDSIFAFSLDGRHDAILSLYHDQGHIACKTLDFEKAITLTLGLPFMRSSVDHGTAYDIAGKGVANTGSMVEATRVCAEFALRKLDGEARRAARA
ncbi:4-hydroxythreonine-4-phosphate dehydrogenase PdxA [Actinotignum timonense]|uniref:4-hydroxythreonine-4-phosphate dehydrogenase PdxA n=1 Tax=Actinotignum timonense TaxID=1870995 RepID=UPI00254D6088|nr:4-hydroxythreonine-4-phosphate dehydrogenase PdxA [Actinotignum timonense]MDK8781770.1 4-hydroxythreonine-4-phosphate dehydrogenase PdxA [Actinotignum timonense]